MAGLPRTEHTPSPCLPFLHTPPYFKTGTPQLTLPAQSSHTVLVIIHSCSSIQTPQNSRSKKIFPKISHHRRLQTKSHHRTTSVTSHCPLLPSSPSSGKSSSLFVSGHSFPLQVSMLLYNLLELPLKVERSLYWGGGEGYPSMHGRLREQLKGNDSLSSIWIPETELTSPGLVANAFNKL